MTATPHIVFVHIGPDLPGHLAVAAGQARRFHSGGIWVVAPAAALTAAAWAPGLRVRSVASEDLGLSELHRQFLRVTRLDRAFRQGFWLHTTERFFCLETLMAKAGLEHVVHLENDVMLYAEPRALLPVLDRCYPALAATFDAPGRCVPGFVYARQAAAVTRLNQFIVQVFAHTERTPNDMALLAGFRATFGARALDMLPIIPAGCPHLIPGRYEGKTEQAETFWNRFEDFGAIFDAAAVGQFLGGVDPRNTGGRDTAGFVNETCIFDPSRFRYQWQTDSLGRRIPFAVDGSGVYRVNNLHIHCKDLGRFAS